MNRRSVLLGALRYEFGMQLRRRSVWVVLALFAALLLPLWALWAQQDLYGHFSRETQTWIPPDPADAVLTWAMFVTWLLPVGVGLVLADRLARDRTTHVGEVLDTVPGSLGARLAGKYLGSTLATLVPVALLYAAVIVFVLTQTPSQRIIPLAARVFAAVVLPGCLFAAGFAVAVPVVLRVPVYQFLFIGYWFWANLMTPKIGFPSPVATMLNATGPWALEGFFGYQWLFLRLHPTAAQAYTSVALLVGLGFAAIAGAWAYLRCQQAHR
jgi:hypothetical protein